MCEESLPLIIQNRIEEGMTQEKTGTWGREQENKNISDISPACLAWCLAPYLCFSHSISSPTL